MAASHHHATLNTDPYTTCLDSTPQRVARGLPVSLTGARLELPSLEPPRERVRERLARGIPIPRRIDLGSHEPLGFLPQIQRSSIPPVDGRLIRPSLLVRRLRQPPSGQAGRRVEGGGEHQGGEQGRTGNGRRAGDSFQRRPLAFARPAKRSI